MDLSNIVHYYIGSTSPLNSYGDLPPETLMHNENNNKNGFLNEVIKLKMQEVKQKKAMLVAYNNRKFSRNQELADHIRRIESTY